MELAGKQKQKRKRSCWAIARAQVRRPDGGRAFLRWLPLVLLGIVMAGVTGRPNSITLRVLPDVPEQPRTEYEGGQMGASEVRGRYKVRPSIHRLLKDCCRAGARNEATAILMSRVPDTNMREWVRARLAAGDMVRLRVHARPEASDDSVIDAWRAELDMDRRADARQAEEERSQARMAQTLANFGNGYSSS